MFFNFIDISSSVQFILNDFKVYKHVFMILFSLSNIKLDMDRK